MRFGRKIDYSGIEKGVNSALKILTSFPLNTGTSGRSTKTYFIFNWHDQTSNAFWNLKQWGVIRPSLLWWSWATEESLLAAFGLTQKIIGAFRLIRSLTGFLGSPETFDEPHYRFIFVELCAQRLFLISSFQTSFAFRSVRRFVAVVKNVQHVFGRQIEERVESHKVRFVVVARRALIPDRNRIRTIGVSR